MNFSKRLIALLFFSFMILFAFVPFIYAQSSAPSSGSQTGNTHAVSCVQTKVGTFDASPPPMPPECASSGGGGGSCQKAPDYHADLASAIKDKFGITFLDFDADHLKWFWEELWNSSATNFSKLANGATITAGYCPDSPPGKHFSCQKACDPGIINIYFGSYAGEEFNKTLITHELGHYIMCKNHESTAISLPDFDSAHDAEGGITQYGGGPDGSDAVTQACTGTSDVSSHNEDFAETVAYFLHPFSKAQSIACEDGQPNPFYDYQTGARNSNFSQHFTWAEKTFGKFACSAQ